MGLNLITNCPDLGVQSSLNYKTVKVFAKENLCE